MDVSRIVCFQEYTLPKSKVAHGLGRYFVGLASLLWFLAVGSGLAEEGAGSSHLMERGPNHRIRSEKKGAKDLVRGMEGSDRFIEIATGINYWTGDRWEETKAEWTVVDGAAVITRGPHKVSLWPNINVDEAVEVTLPDGQLFKSTPAFLVLRNLKSGAGVVVATVKDSVGEIVAPNVVVYPDAFDKVKASLRYTYKASEFEQDVLIQDAGGLYAQEYGLPIEGSRLELWTQVFTHPAIQDDSKESHRVGSKRDIHFGSMKIGLGKAFLSTTQDPVHTVDKDFVEWDGKRWLVESLGVSSVNDMLDQLPYFGKKDDQAAHPTRGHIRSETQASTDFLADLGKRGISGRVDRSHRKNESVRILDATDRRVELAAVSKQPAMVLDYTLLATGTNMVFERNTTYYVSGDVILTGTSEIRENCVIKFVSWGYGTNSAKIRVQGPLFFSTTALGPCIVTGRDDDTVGELITGSSGVPSAYYGQRAFHIDSPGIPQYFHDVIFRNVGTAVYVETGSSATLANAQIVGSYRGVDNQNAFVWLKNVLGYQLIEAVSGGSSSTNIAEHLTLDQVNTLVLGGAPSLKLTNSLLVSVLTNAASYTGAAVGVESSGGSVFASAGQGAHYLKKGSSYRDTGVATVSNDLMRDLAERTTFAPVILPSTLTETIALRSHIHTDTSSPDYGFHYPKVDFLAKEVMVSGASLEILPGVVIAAMGGTKTKGIILGSGASLFSRGAAGQYVRWVSHAAVQETVDATVGTNTYTAFLQVGNASGQCKLDFTEITGLRDSDIAVYAESNSASILSLNNCRLAPSSRFQGGNLGMTNTFLGNGTQSFIASSGSSYTVRNTLFYQSQLSISGTTTNDCSIRDSQFDFSGSAIAQSGDVDNGWNAYQTAIAARLSPNQSSDVLVTSMTYERGPLGNFYQPTNSPLIDAGSAADASTIGLYHYTSLARQTKETNSVLNIGLHFPADSKVVKAIFVGIDAVTQGSWKTVYGSQGYDVLQDASSYPTYASVTASGKSDRTWQAPTTDTRGLERVSLANRIAAGWYSSNAFEFVLTQTNSTPHRLTLYFLDWDVTNRLQRVDVMDSVTGEIWDTRTVSNFNLGQYFTWEVSSNLRFRISSLNSAADAVLSGLFLDAAPAVDWDLDGDLLADAVEDKNGNGVRDGVEASWIVADTDGDGVNDLWEVSRGRNPYGGLITDTNGLAKLKVFTPLK